MTLFRSWHLSLEVVKGLGRVLGANAPEEAQIPQTLELLVGIVVLELLLPPVTVGNKHSKVVSNTRGSSSNARDDEGLVQVIIEVAPELRLGQLSNRGRHLRSSKLLGGKRYNIPS